MLETLELIHACWDRLVEVAKQVEPNDPAELVVKAFERLSESGLDIRYWTMGDVMAWMEDEVRREPWG